MKDKVGICRWNSTVYRLILVQLYPNSITLTNYWTIISSFDKFESDWTHLVSKTIIKTLCISFPETLIDII